MGFFDPPLKVFAATLVGGGKCLVRAQKALFPEVHYCLRSQQAWIARTPFSSGNSRVRITVHTSMIAFVAVVKRAVHELFQIRIDTESDRS